MQILFLLIVDVEWVTAAGVGPHQREGDLGSCTLLQQQLAFAVEEEHAERSVQHTLLDVLVQMTCDQITAQVEDVSDLTTLRSRKKIHERKKRQGTEKKKTNEIRTIFLGGCSNHDVIVVH